MLQSHYAPMTRNTATSIFTELAAVADKAPEWIELFPKGPAIAARDGRSWTLDPVRVLSAFASNQGPLAIDYEHGQALKAPKGDEAPAAGWITALEERNGAVWGHVEWTKAAASKIVEREYRFISPDFDHTREGVILQLNGAGLVNRPALVMTALSRKQTEKENDMSLKAIAAALGLADDADEKAVLAAITARNDQTSSLCGLLKIDAGSNAGAIADAVKKLQSDTETALASIKSAPQATELASVSATLKETQTALAALQKKDADREIDAALDRASAEGKITPASRETYRAMCSAEGGLERFVALTATLPVICAPSALGQTTVKTGEAADDLNPTALAFKARKYQDEQAAVGLVLSISEAIEHVKAAG